MRNKQRAPILQQTNLMADGARFGLLSLEEPCLAIADPKLRSTWSKVDTIKHNKPLSPKKYRWILQESNNREDNNDDQSAETTAEPAFSSES